jgi:hypothetical protein
MPRILADLTGVQFGRWTVLGPAPKKIGQSHWYCRCSCGTEKSVSQTTLRQGTSRSCGCLKNERAAAYQWKHGCSNGNSTEYTTWAGMKQRCFDAKCKSYHRYGGRGITVCQRWQDSFVAFLEDMGPRPSPKHTLERINNNGNYEPGNCRWATQIEQARNRRSSRTLTYKNQTRTIAEWSELTGIGQSTIAFRLDHGWSPEQTLETPVDSRRGRRRG